MTYGEKAKSKAKEQFNQSISLHKRIYTARAPPNMKCMSIWLSVYVNVQRLQKWNTIKLLCMWTCKKYDNVDNGDDSCRDNHNHWETQTIS